jgi:hypothetical protein
VTDTLPRLLVPGPVPADTPALRVALVGCGKDKTTHPAPARDLYVGNLFVAARRYVEAQMTGRGIDAWYVLSARYGLVHPDRVLEPYDAVMPTNLDEVRTWVTKVDTAFRCIDPGYGKWSTKGGRLTVDILAGGAYADPLITCWRGISWEINTPLAGLQMGQRLGWFKNAREATA